MAGSCDGKILNRFFMQIRCLENLSSGENRAGCADSVGKLLGDSFYKSNRLRKRPKNIRRITNLKCINTFPLVIEIVHKMHDEIRELDGCKVASNS